MEKWKQILVDRHIYQKLSESKAVLNKEEGAKLSFSDVMLKLMGANLYLYSLDKEIRDYISAYLNELIRDKQVEGVMLFGSIVKGNWNKYSDIDFFIVVNSDPLKYLHRTNEIDQKLESLQNKLFEKGLSLYVSPLIINRENLNEFRQIYLEIFKYGVILYEKDGTMTNFIENIRKNIKQETIEVNGELISMWKRKKN